MQKHESIDDALIEHTHRSIDDVLSEKITFKDELKAFGREMKKNAGPESICILSCEAGEWVTEIFAYLANVPFMNELGLLGGITAGASYATYHVFRHAKQHHQTPSIADCVAYVATTESGCITGATLSEYGIGKFLATANNPLTLNSTIMRTAGLVPAFALGLALMSAFTYMKQEIARWVSDKNALHNLMPDYGLSYYLNGRKLKVEGANSCFVIREKKLPATYQKDFDKEKSSLYSVGSTLAKVNGVGCCIQSYAESMFKKAGHSLDPVHKIGCA